MADDIVIPRASLPPVEVVEGGALLATRHARILALTADPVEVRAIGLEYLALAEALAKYAPVDPGQVNALAGVVTDAADARAAAVALYRRGARLDEVP